MGKNDNSAFSYPSQRKKTAGFTFYGFYLLLKFCHLMELMFTVQEYIYHKQLQQLSNIASSFWHLTNLNYYLLPHILFYCEHYTLITPSLFLGLIQKVRIGITISCFTNIKRQCLCLGRDQQSVFQCPEKSKFYGNENVDSPLYKKMASGSGDGLSNISSKCSYLSLAIFEYYWENGRKC